MPQERHDSTHHCLSASLVIAEIMALVSSAGQEDGKTMAINRHLRGILNL